MVYKLCRRSLVRKFLALLECIETAEKIGVKSYVVEQDTNFVGSPFNSLKMSADFLAKYMK